MAIYYPGAVNRQLTGKSKTLLGPRIINVHTMVWDLASCGNYFAQPGNPYSHFGTGPNGEVWQWQDLTYRAASDLDGNPFCISIENADKGAGYPTWSGSDVPRFTAAQAEAIAHLIAWLCVRFGIPPHAVADSLPSRVGPGYHRHGINPWRVAGGVLYSNSYGKVCPGDRRIGQFHNEIMPLVRAIIEGDTLSAAEVADIKAHVTAEINRVMAELTTNQGGRLGDIWTAIAHEADDSRPFFAQDTNVADSPSFVLFKQAGVAVWVRSEAELQAWWLDRVYADERGETPKPWHRDTAHIRQYTLVGPVPDGWD